MSSGQPLRSPVSLQPLQRNGYALEAPGERWPVVEGIAFLRADRRALADRALAALDAGSEADALVLLLADQDDWARTPPPSLEACRSVAQDRHTLSFRDAMARLDYGAVATYFAHRWSDPTFLSGLALAEAHWPEPRRVLEVACGTGHFLRAFAGEDVALIGADVVFSKLWLAQTYVAPDAEYICFTADAPWPLDDHAVDLAFCHDAFYFFPNKSAVAAEMQRVATVVLIGHAHNSAVDNLSAGAPLTVAGYADLYPGALLYDDLDLTQAFQHARAPIPQPADTLQQAAAISLAWHAGEPCEVAGRLERITGATTLRRNPLYQQREDEAEIVWPSARYEQEYGVLATYPQRTDVPFEPDAGRDVAALVRNRVYLDLPPRW